ncbi:MAG TPA: PepSY domain-containing protein, partial [Sphingomicrobium sp.]
MSTTVRLRRIWFQIHKWIGIILALLIIPISLTGAALVWHDALDDWLNPQRVVEAAPSLQPGQYAAAARAAAQPGERLASLTYPSGGEGPVVAALAKPHKGPGRPVRTSVYLHPTNAKMLDRAASNTGLVHVMHVLHGSLM